VYEILINVVDEAQARFPSRIDVILVVDDFMSITDNGCQIREKFEEDLNVMLPKCDVIINK